MFVVRIQDFVLEKGVKRQSYCPNKMQPSLQNSQYRTTMRNMFIFYFFHILVGNLFLSFFFIFSIRLINIKIQGTNLKLEMALECNKFEGLGVLMDFTKKKRTWVHMNLVARVGPKEELLVFFAEFYLPDDEYVLATLALVNTWDRQPVSKKDDKLSEQDAIEFAEFAIHDDNEKHGTNSKLEMALECNRFEGLGVLMDFTKKKTTWVHMNLVARVGPKEELLVLFAEFYLSDDEYVLATLVLVNTSDRQPVSKKDELWCRLCPDGILHPVEGCFF
ncbi:sequence-specific DNA binding transcription factors [Striga asiatica]|uniref:Sequence-specific DNA binding transcription factors n=1 Tax=Striga asiatica TaxID=4170 RepID=A0A5A7P1K1_STRAF|nr:sequence-specific DNA binding transcription factors [Striga asiatica]